MNTFEAIKTRRSTRKFSDKEVTRESIDQIVEAGRLAPSGGNSQTTHFLVITNKDVLAKLQEAVKSTFASMEEEPGMYMSKVFSIRAAKSGKYIYDYNTPCLIVTANKIGYGNAMADCACALENMMLAANELDMGSVWINQLRWLAEEEQIVAAMRELGMAEDEIVCGALAVGWPATEDGMPERVALPRTGNPVTYID